MSAQNVDLKCPHCGSECRWLDDVSTKVCLHCGYQEKLVDSDAVRKAKITADKEIEIARLQRDNKKNEARAELLRRAIPYAAMLFLVILCFVMALITR